RTAADGDGNGGGAEGGEQQGKAGRGAAPGFGVSLGDLTPDSARQLQLPAGTTGALVENVEPATPAAEAGLAPGDVILQVNRQVVHSAADASSLLGQVKSGQVAFLLLTRQGNRVFLEMRRE
ncbi:MAG TPA: PDZ domain-containing protein, partial [Vicinamibacterales bacterium]